MKVNSYRVEFSHIDGKFYRCQHFLNCIKAEESLYQHSRNLENKANIIHTNSRYGNIWESELIIAI